MTKQEAATLLGVSPETPEAEIKKKYSELFNDFQIRLTNAPTPNLKKLYQKNIQELNDALQVMLGDTAGTVLKDLPSSTPTYGHSSAESSGPTQTSSSIKTTGNVKTGAASKAEAAKEKQLAEDLKKTKKRFGTLLMVSIFLLTALALMTILFIENRQELSTLRPLDQENAKLKKELEPFSNSKFKVRNSGQYDLEIIGVTIHYKNKNGEIVKYEDNHVNLSAKPGSTVELNKYYGSKEIWDGSVIAYSAVLVYNGQTIIQGGLWNADSKDGYLVLNLTGF